jgi:dUTP pyrophosphatase
MASYEQYLDTGIGINLALKYAGMARGFIKVKDTHKKNELDVKITLPTRGSAKSAGYDLHCPVEIILLPGEQKLIWTDVKAYMLDDEVLEIYPRSSVGIKKSIQLANTVGIIDSDYFSNKDNDGNIGICLYNRSNVLQIIQAGERVAQGIFKKYLIADGDVTTAKRSGGIGSTGQ